MLKLLDNSMFQQVYKYLVMTKNFKKVNIRRMSNFTYANPAKPPTWKIRNATMYAVTNVIAHMVKAHL